MNRNILRMVAIVVAALSWPSLAGAQTACDQVVDDAAHVLADPGRVAAAAALGNAGATVRVRTLAATGDSGLDQAVFQLRARCPSWQGSSAGTWKSTMLVLAYAPNDKDQIGVYFGVSLSSRLGGGKWQDVLRDRLVPQIHAFKNGDKAALVGGFAATLGEFQALLVRPSTGGATVINQAADLHGLWSVMGWLLAILVIALIGGAIAWALILRSRTQSARAEARRVRSECVSGLLEVTEDAALAGAGATILAAPEASRESLQRKLDRGKSLGSAGLAALSRFDPIGGANPNVVLAAAACNSNRMRYESIIASYVAPARILLGEINRGEVDDTSRIAIAPPSRRFLPDDASSVSSVRMTASASPGSAWGRPTPTVIVERDGGGDMLTGVLIGEALSRPRYEREHEEPRESHHRETRNDDYGGGRDNDSGDRGGSFSVDSSGSSDSGGSFDSGSSSGDSGGSSSSC